MTRHTPHVLVAILFALTACSDDGAAPPDGGQTDGAVTDQGSAGGETGPAGDGAGPAGDGAGPATDGTAPADQGVAAVMPEIPTQVGVAYIAHFHTSDLRVLRVDGAEPKLESQLDLGAGQLTHDLALDPVNDLLVAVSDANKEVVIYKLSRPAGPTTPVALPSKLATVTVGDKIPLFARIDPYQKRLYVVGAPTGALPPSYHLYAFDLSDPAKPTAVAGSPYDIPITSSLALDPVRQVLFVADNKNDVLHGYDLRGDKFNELGGGPLDLRALYPQKNQFSFQARALRVDPFRNRIYAARAQSAMSELIILEYPSALPTALATYSKLAKMSDLKAIADPFDVDKPIADRPNLLDAFVPALDLKEGHVWLSAGAWTGSAVGGMVAGIMANNTLAKGCEAFEGFGCWYRRYDQSGTPTAYLRTDGAACVDYTHKVVVGTSIDSYKESDPGAVHVFKYQSNGTMTPWLPSASPNLKVGGLPIGAVCH